MFLQVYFCCMFFYQLLLMVLSFLAVLFYFYWELTVLGILSVIFFKTWIKVAFPHRNLQVLLQRALRIHRPGIFYINILTWGVSDHQVCMNSVFRPPSGQCLWFCILKRALLCSTQAVLLAVPWEGGFISGALLHSGCSPLGSLSYPYCPSLVLTWVVVEGSVKTLPQLWFQLQFWGIILSKLTLCSYWLHPTSSAHIHFSAFAPGPWSKPRNLVGMHARTAHKWEGSCASEGNPPQTGEKAGG